MRLAEIDDTQKRQRSQAEGLTLASEEHSRQVETLHALREQLKRLEQELTSLEIDQAQAELEHSQTAVETEQHRLDEQKRALIRENLQLTARCEKAVEKAKETLKSGGFAKDLGRAMAVEAAKIGLGLVTGLMTGDTTSSDSWVEERLGRVAKATQQHVDRLEKIKEQLLESRKLLEES